MVHLKSMKHLLTQITFALFLSLSTVGCNVGPAETPVNSIKPIDTAVVNTAKMNLNTDPVLAACRLQVQAENDLLVLRGTVPTEEAKTKAEEIAKKTKGVEKVANHIEVKAE